MKQTKEERENKKAESAALREQQRREKDALRAEKADRRVRRAIARQDRKEARRAEKADARQAAQVERARIAAERAAVAAEAAKADSRCQRASDSAARKAEAAQRRADRPAGLPIFDTPRTGRRTASWRRLDNVAKIFPSTSGRRDTNVFRFTCELKESIDPDKLQTALDRTVEVFPQFVCTMRSGLFWHYLEQSSARPTVNRERFTPCFPIYSRQRRRLLFYVSYYRSRINLEMYHALTDGTGALQMFRILVYEYLRAAYPDQMHGIPPEYDAALSQRGEDSFTKYYSHDKVKQSLHNPGAYQLRGELTDDNRYRVIEAVCDAGEVLKIAHAHGTTMTVLLAALYIRAVGDVMPVSSRRPVSLTVPINLRKYYSSVTAGNFFGTMRVSYDFRKGDGSIEDIIRAVAAEFERELAPESVAVKMNSLIALQRNFLLRIAPLPLKDFVMRIAKKISDVGETAVISNIGRIEMPKEAAGFIDHFSVFSSTENMHFCICSYNDRLSLSLCSSFVDSGVERAFLRSLAKAGVRITLNTNYGQD